MELRQLKYFDAIATCGSFSEASRRCFISQSAISQQIRLLEEELKTELFTRTSHRVALTESGEAMLPLVRKVLEGVDACQQRVGEFNGMLSGELSVGLTYSLEPLLRKTVMAFLRTYPHVRLNIHYKTIPELITLLRNGQLDMAFGIRVRGEEERFDSVSVCEYRLCAVMRREHPLAGRQQLTFDDLKHQKLILPEQGIRGNNAVERFLSDEADVLQVRAVINDPCAIMNLLRQTNCVSILTDQMAEGDAGLCAVPIAELSQSFVYYCHFQKGVYRKRAATAFLKLLQHANEMV